MDGENGATGGGAEERAARRLAETGSLAAAAVAARRLRRGPRGCAWLADRDDLLQSSAHRGRSSRLRPVSENAIRELAEEVEDLLAGAALLGAARRPLGADAPRSRRPPPTGQREESARRDVAREPRERRPSREGRSRRRPRGRRRRDGSGRSIRASKRALDASNVLKSTLAQFCRSARGRRGRICAGRGARHGHQDELEEALRRRGRRPRVRPGAWSH